MREVPIVSLSSIQYIVNKQIKGCRKILNLLHYNPAFTCNPLFVTVTFPHFFNSYFYNNNIFSDKKRTTTSLSLTLI